MPAIPRNSIDAHLEERILSFNKRIPLPGIASPLRLESLVKQVLDSIERVNRITSLCNTRHPPHYANPSREDFNPLRAAAFHKQQGNIDEAFWLVFLATHFGEDENRTRWSHVRNVYSALGNDVYWNWERASNDPIGIRKWLQSNKNTLQSNGRFSNHRKYESLLDEHTGKSIASYIDWIGDGHKHLNLITRTNEKLWKNPSELFDTLYKSMEAVWRFGRTAKFDFLCIVGKLGLMDIEPGSPYLQDATGPLSGARLLFGNSSTKNLNFKLRELGLHLNMPFSQQIIEDATCNFSKSPDNFISFLPAE